MEALNKIKKLQNNISEIRNLFNNLIPKWSADKKTYDKVRYGFSEGDSDGWYKSSEILIHFNAWCGTYGDSSTYQQIRMDGDVFKEYFMKYLNENKKTIMMSISDMIEKDAIKLKQEAQKELNTELEKLNQL